MTYAISSYINIRRLYAHRCKCSRQGYQAYQKLDPEANISQICREALTSYAAALERARTEITDEDMDDIIEHLEQSAPHPQIEPDWADYAWQDAQDWIRTITAHDWHYFLYSYDHHKDNSRELYIHAQFYGLRSRGEVKNFNDRFMETRTGPGVRRS